MKRQLQVLTVCAMMACLSAPFFVAAQDDTSAAPPKATDAKRRSPKMNLFVAENAVNSAQVRELMQAVKNEIASIHVGDNASHVKKGEISTIISFGEGATAADLQKVLQRITAAQVSRVRVERDPSRKEGIVVVVHATAKHENLPALMKQLQSSSVQLDAVLATRTEGAPKDSKRTGLDDPLTTSDEPIAAYADDEADEQILKIFGLLHIEAKFAVRIVQTIFTDVRAEADEKSNRLVAYGAKRDLDVIEAMLLKLDEGPGERWSGTFQELPKVTGVVLDYDAKANVASISIGADDGLKADQSFFLVRGQFVLAHATVVKAQPDQSLVKVTRRFVEIRKGDAVSFTATLKVDEHRLPNLNADLDVDPAGSHAPGSPAAVTQPDRRALNDLESRTEKIATEIRATKQSMSKADLERARAQLTREVARAFRLRQQLQSQRISELRERLERMEQQVKRRDGQGAKIIDKRVEDLLK